LKPLIYLELRQFLNSIKNTFRTPKRLIPALFIGAWMFSWFMQMMLFVGGATPSRRGFGMTAILKHVPVEMIIAGTFILLSFGSLVVVYQAFSSGSLIFSVAHIDFLFPTPIPRRTVLLVKLIKDYLKYGFWVAFFFIFFGAPALWGLNLSLFPYGLVSIAALVAYLLFVVNVAHTVNLIFTFGFERLKQAGAVIKVALLIGLLSAVAFGIYQYVQTGNSYVSVLWAANSPVVKTVFAPADWCSVLLLSPLRAMTPDDYFHLAALWILAVMSFALLLSRNENIYEPSLGVSIKFAKRKVAMRSGDYTGVRLERMLEKGATSAGGFAIPPFGKGAVALLWKSLLGKYRMSRSQLLLMLVLPAVVVFIIQKFVPSSALLHNIPFALLYITFVLSMTAQPEMRAELKHANILKAMPIASWKVMLAQALYGATYLGAGVIMFAISMWTLVPQTRGDLLVICTLASPFIGFACVSATIIPAILYPDTRDVAQNYICNLLGFALVSIAIIPTLVLGIMLLGIAGISYYLALMIICAVNVIVGAAGISIAGAVFGRFDPTNE